jgi:hypothetical protein
MRIPTAVMHDRIEEKNIISLLPHYDSPATLLVSDTIPCFGKRIVSKPIKQITNEISRQHWTEGLYVNKTDLDKIKRYKSSDGNYKNDFDARQFLGWVKTIEENTAICDMENKKIGKGVFVPYGKKLPKGTFIPSSGIIKLDPTEEELATKVHCSALQDLNTRTKIIYGFIDPAQKGGILDLINHAPDKQELTHFAFQNPTIRERVATSNLRSTIKFYDGYAIMGLEAFENIDGGEHGQQLLWSYARSCEYLENNTSKLVHPVLFLFDNRNEHNGKTIDPRYYALQKINIFIDDGELMIKKITSLTRWEIMEDSPDSGFIMLIDDNKTDQDKTKQLLIEKSFLQVYLQKNPIADRIILDIRNK